MRKGDGCEAGTGSCSADTPMQTVATRNNVALR